jgi:hypothetical protein
VTKGAAAGRDAVSEATALIRLFRSGARLEAETLCCHQLNILQRKSTKRAAFKSTIAWFLLGCIALWYAGSRGLVTKGTPAGRDAVFDRTAPVRPVARAATSEFSLPVDADRIIASECSSSTCSSLGAGLKPRTYFRNQCSGVSFLSRICSSRTFFGANLRTS